MTILAANAFSIVCICAACGLIVAGYENGWGWLLLLAWLGLHTYASRECDCEDEDEESPPAKTKEAA